MPWPTSSAFTAGQTAGVSSNLNKIRADLTATNGYVEKTADEAVTSSAVLQSDDHLFYTIGSTGKYVVDVWLLVNSAANAAGDLAVGFTFPTATASRYAGLGPDIGLASGSVQTGQWAAAQSITSGGILTGYGTSTAINTIQLHLVMTFSATGTLQFQWAQAVSNASATRVLAGSHMLVRQVA